MTKKKPAYFMNKRWPTRNSHLKKTILGSLVLAAVVSLILIVCRKSDIQNQSVINVRQESESKQINTAISTQLPTSLFSYIVKSGDNFAGILGKFDIPEKEAVRYYSSLRSVGLPAIYPGDSLVLKKDENDQIKECSLCSKLQHWYHVRQIDSVLCAEKKCLETTKHLCVVKGSIETSLYEDMLRQGAGDALVFKLTDIFAWDINFFMDPRKGDAFEVLFEKKYRDGHFVGHGSVLAAKYVSGKKTYYAIAMKDSLNTINYFDQNGKSIQKQFLKAPLNFRRISSRFSYSRRHPILGIYRPHLGVDYAAPRGTPVYSSADGTVIFTGYKGGYGNHVRISHGKSYETYYGHLHKIQSGIRRGVRVKQGQFIGTVGSTGLSTGPHLDYRMKCGSRFINPMTLSLPPKDGVPEKDLDEFNRIKCTCLFTLEQRFKQEGCYVVQVIPPEPSTAIASKTSRLPEKEDGHTTRS